MQKLTFILLLIPVLSLSQIKISGFVYDNATGETLVGANIYSDTKGTSTNAYGHFTYFTNNKSINISYVGYHLTTLNIEKDTIINIYLKPSELLNEVIVSGKVEKRTELSSFQLKANTISSLPVLLGEADIFKSIQLLPGVGMGADGSSDYYVRGGSKDQNLIMIDDVPIYTSTHSTGYFSAINNEVVKDVKLYKGAFPARYSGRVSSVMDVRTRDGNTQTINSSLSISPFILQSTFETPIVKNKSGLLLGFRHSLYDLILSISPDPMPIYGFYDMNVKYHHKLGDSDKIIISLYKGADKYKFNEETENTSRTEKSEYGNVVTSLKWSHVFSNSIFMNTTIAYNNYNFYYTNESETIRDSEGNEYKYYTKSNFGNTSDNFRVKNDFDYSINDTHTLQFGASVIHQKYNPTNSYTTDDSNNVISKSDTVSFSISNTTARLYLEDIIKLKTLNINVGANLAFLTTGSKSFITLEPRVSATYDLFRHFKVSASYSRMSQNLHLVTQSGPLLPEDLWYPTTDSIPPVVSDQIALGFNYHHKKITLAVEGFNKQMNNVTEKRWKIDADSPLNLIEVGKGWSYGLETMLVFDLEKVMLNINYTWARSMRKFDNINYGKDFPFRYDRPHDIKSFAIWKLTNKWSLSTVATWKSGNATTVHQANSPHANSFFKPFTMSGYPSSYEYYGDRNSYRLPNYFRWDIDISYNYKGNWGKYILKFGIYNLTNHHNSYKITVDPYGVNSQSLIPIMPYISYSWRLR